MKKSLVITIIIFISSLLYSINVYNANKNMDILKEGDKAPFLSEKGNENNLSKFKGKKVILFFYPKDNTPGCTAEACNLRDNYQELKTLGYEVVGVSPDSETSHQKFIDKQNLPFILIPDTEKEILKAYGAWGLKKMYGREYEGVLRTTFIIDEDGTVQHIIKKVKTKDHTAQILELLDVE